ncbi:hypothetical protein QZH41_013425, partial [Actinostola sp. cb2023]
RPLSEYIKNYETLSYSTSALSKQHDRHRRSTSPHSSPILLNFEALGRDTHGQRYINEWQRRRQNRKGPPPYYLYGRFQ